MHCCPPERPPPCPLPRRFFGDELTWNLRDSHFLDTCKLILGHLSRRTQHPPRLVVWAHNSHLGDARATDMGQRRGELNIGQLMRQEFGMERVYNVGWAAGRAAAARRPPPLIPLDVAPSPCCLIRPAPLPFTTPCRRAACLLAAPCCCRFTTHAGTVAAADDWDTPVQLKAVRKGMPGSYEHLFHK